MKIELEDQIFVNASAAAVTSAVERALAGYEVTSAVTEAVKAAVLEAKLPSQIGEAVRAEVERAAPAAIARTVASVEPVLIAAMESALRSALVAMTYGLTLGKPSYMSQENTRLWADAEQKILGMKAGDAQ